MASTNILVDAMELEPRKDDAKPVRVTRNGRRYFSAQHKRMVVERCLEPGASVSATALAHGLNANVVRKWIRQYQTRKLAATSKLLPVHLVEAAPSKASRRSRRPTIAVGCAASPIKTIEIQIGAARVSVGSVVDAGALQMVLDALLRAR